MNPTIFYEYLKAYIHNLAYFKSILHKIGSKGLLKNLSCKTMLIKSNKHVKCESNFW
jgi:hypothetical protein